MPTQVGKHIPTRVLALALTFIGGLGMGVAAGATIVRARPVPQVAAVLYALPHPTAFPMTQEN